ncbi:MAG: carbohydrate porin [Simplicispira sp.]|nr:carbohydrate porin [Simplicispira sp.]
MCCRHPAIQRGCDGHRRAGGAGQGTGRARRAPGSPEHPAAQRAGNRSHQRERARIGDAHPGRGGAAAGSARSCAQAHRSAGRHQRGRQSHGHGPASKAQRPGRSGFGPQPCELPRRCGCDPAGRRLWCEQGQSVCACPLGQGDGLALRPTYTGTANSSTFSGTDPDDAQFTLAQAWYQLDVPLSQRGEHKAVFTVGKIDPFGFFDQNAIADDETRHFANNVFVHNPLLDSGGDIGADRFGFSPGAIAAYENSSDKSLPWGASLGVFGTGNGANFSASTGKPFVLAQAWISPRINQLPGTYRAYAWSNARGADFDGSDARHAGVGMSLDQRFTDALTLFALWPQTSGRVPFDDAFTVGAELDGSAWRRGSDGLGLALGMLRTSGHYASASAADPASYGYVARGAERIGELYYRMHLNGHVEITPSLQVIARPAANPDAKGIALLGLRARVGF